MATKEKFRASTSLIPCEPFLSAEQAGQLIGIHPVTLLRWAREGRVSHQRLGRKVKFRPSALNALGIVDCADDAVRVPEPREETAHELN